MLNFTNFKQTETFPVSKAYKATQVGWEGPSVPNLGAAAETNPL